MLFLNATILRMEESAFLQPSKVLEAVGLSEGMSVADLGSGSGFFTRAAARAVGPTGVVWAVDLQGDLLTRTKNLSLGEGLHNVEIIRGDIEAPKGSHLPEAKFDVVLLSNILFSLEDKLAAVAETERLLCPGGRGVIIDWSDSFDGMGPHPDHVYTADAARRLFEERGLIYSHNIPAGAYHWGFVVRKKGGSSAQ